MAGVCGIGSGFCSFQVAAVLVLGTSIAPEIPVRKTLAKPEQWPAAYCSLVQPWWTEDTQPGYVDLKPSKPMG